jgi:glycosyltransferase involved in cell wall biosynthesis
VYVSAIRSGTGVKNKLLESMAMGLPVVCTSESAIGLNVRPGKHLLVAGTPEEFAAHVVRLLDDPRRARELACAGRQLVEAEYSWQSRASKFESLYQDLAEARRHRSYTGAGYGS